MSLFNMIVRPHPLAPFLLETIDWARPVDDVKKYPLLGRLRYVWLDDNKNVKLLLKDGPTSWSENQEEILNQIKTHETFVSVEVYEKDPVYLIATFKPIKDSDIFTDFDNIETMLAENNIPSLLKDPFEIFNEKLEEIKTAK